MTRAQVIERIRFGGAARLSVRWWNWPKRAHTVGRLWNRVVLGVFRPSLIDALRKKNEK